MKALYFKLKHCIKIKYKAEDVNYCSQNLGLGLLTQNLEKPLLAVACSYIKNRP